jgi:hypothetical protein
VSISWQEWKAWTDTPEVDELETRLEGCVDFSKVHEFIEVFGDWLTYCRIQETSRHMDSPGRIQRTYCEALRDIAQKLTELKTKDERNFIHGRSANNGSRRAINR